MPPKEKVSKVKIQETAFEMTREYGFVAVTARKLAERMECSTQPIFRNYENMNELKSDLFYMSVRFFNEYILSRKSKNKPSYILVALSYIELSIKEKNLFELIASIDDFGSRTIGEFLLEDEWKQITDKLPGLEDRSLEEKRDVFLMYWMFVHGMASLLASKRVSFDDKQIRGLLEKAYEGFKAK